MDGGNCCEYGWMEQARANLILDNLIAEHKARPMILVMALGARSGPSEALEPVPSQMEGFRPPAGRQTNSDPGNLFEKDLLTGIIPFIDSRFRTMADADHRALSGLSQGGIQTVTIGPRHTDTFHWLVPMSAGAESQGDDQFVEISCDVYQHWRCPACTNTSCGERACMTWRRCCSRRQDSKCAIAAGSWERNCFRL